MGKDTAEENDMVDDDQDFDPMIYDAMRELATQVSGRYIEWADAATDSETEKHWMSEAVRIGREARAVDTRSRKAIEAKRAEFRQLLSTMPLQAPEFPA